MKYFETAASADSSIESVFVSLVTDVLNVLLDDGVRPAVCSLVCNSRRRVASCICPSLPPFFNAPAYAQLEHEVAKGGKSFATAFAAASMPLDGLANAALVPVLSRAQLLLLLCCCGHARLFINSIMPQDIRHSTENCRRVLLLQLFGLSTVSRLADAGSKLKKIRTTGGRMLTAPQLGPMDAAWERVSMRSSCACCHVTFGMLFNRHHHCRLVRPKLFVLLV